MATTDPGWAYVIPITPQLVAHQGHTLASFVVDFTGGPGHGALPAKMPRVGIRRVTAAGVAERLLTSNDGWVSDASASVGAYEVAHTLTYTPDQYNVIDVETYNYELVFANESGANALVGGVIMPFTLSLVP